MALPFLVKYVYTNASDEVIRRGKKIHSIRFAELIDFDDLFGNAVFRVKDDTYSTFYKVYIEKLRDPKGLVVRCSCPYNIGDICRHEAAALFQLQEMIDKGLLQGGESKYDQRHTVAKMKTIDVKTLRQLSSSDTITAAENYLRTRKARIELAENETVKASVDLNGNTYQVVIKKNEERNFDTSCDYDDLDHPLCLPKIIVLLQLLHAYGPHYFDTIRNWDKEKNKLLEIYGYSLNDDLKGKFEFTYKDGKPFLRVLDSSIKRVTPTVNTPKSVLHPTVPIVEKKETLSTVIENTVNEVEFANRIGVVVNFNAASFPHFTIDAVVGEPNDEQNAFVGKIEKLDITRYVELERFSESDKELLALIRKLQSAEINKYVNKNSPFAGIWDNIIEQSGDSLTEDTKGLMNEYLFPRLKKLFFDQEKNPLIYSLAKNKPFTTQNLEPLQLNVQAASPTFAIKTNNNNFYIESKIAIGAYQYNLEDNESESSLFFLYNQQLYLWENIDTVQLVEKFSPSGTITITQTEWEKKLQEFIIPLTVSHKVDFEKGLVLQNNNSLPDISVFLIEKGDFLVFKPVFSYEGKEAYIHGREEMIIPSGNKVVIVKRNKEKETHFIQQLKNLHSNFFYDETDGSLALKGTDVLKNNWFFLFVDAMKEAKTNVFGYEALKNFRFNTAKPQTKVFISSNTDWFDAKVDIVFGDQKVTVADVKKALANKQQFVPLSDGTLGILPEEWIKKYSLLFRIGEGKTNTLKLSQYHQSVIDDLYNQRDEEELFFKLEEKYDRLREFNSIKEVSPPEEVKNILRPYQIAGFQWLNYLSDVKWGGILADDMGLGKTIQALSFLSYYNKQNGSLKAIVVCPTTLIYNWENEIKKFTPSLSYKIHHGPLRTRSQEELSENNIIITTYGTLRSDIKILSSFELDYVVLDESQAIKNPSSKVTKAACLLNAKHRLCMSGTPLQNNTFDVYAQMNFLNPGMLGSVEFFRQEFAIPIDKLGEPERKEHLKKILYPFLLRRTKEQVAKDLPEKQEMILWCEMEKEQRKIYDAYRNDFREKILGNIQEQGIHRSQLSILQGLMKLRQICDSPAILNEEEKFENHSIKLDELGREIEENIGNHKALIFSQFLGMLALIRKKLDELGIKYEYFDGSTSAPDREKAIQSFQNNEEVRVFLISLKAGGVGLNLTAADYVYIVDPWWNPAVEQQAIDRTHRIGQTKNIFAYRMICKDTIEDKIITLQERKKTLAKEIISDDTSFVKSLSKEDVEYLFS